MLPGIDEELTIEWARRADDGPFTSLGFFDRLVYDSLEPLTTLATCAGVTEEIRLATTIVAGPLRPTALLAKTAATIDVLSDGRLTLGIGLGARPDDYEAANVPYDERGPRLSEQLAGLREYWDTDEIGPSPVQDGGPEILIGGESDQAFKRVAQHGDGYVHGGGPPRAFADRAERAREAWSQADRAGKPSLWGHGYYAIGEEEAEQGREYLLDYYSFTGPFAERIADGLLTSPQEIIQFVRGYEEEGCDELVLFPTVADPEQYDRLEEVVGSEWD